MSERHKMSGIRLKKVSCQVSVKADRKVSRSSGKLILRKAIRAREFAGSSLRGPGILSIERDDDGSPENVYLWLTDRSYQVLKVPETAILIVTETPLP